MAAWGSIAKALSKAMPGITAFFGLEWLTSGGVGNAISGTTGMSSWVSNIVVLAILGVIGYALIRRWFPEVFGEKKPVPKGGK